METWTVKATKVWGETHDALQAVVDELNQGQRQKLAKDEKLRELLDRYGVEYGK